MTLKIYGNMRSSSFRVVWVAEELRLDYRLVKIETEACSSDPTLVALNPNKKIPVIDDDGTILWESMAINLYLARKVGGPLAPKNDVEDAEMQMWSFWVSGECLTDCFDVLSHTVLLPDERRSIETVQASIARLQRPLAVVDGHLAQHRYLVGQRFTMADLNVASVIGWLAAADLDLSAYPDLSIWLAACAGRSAARKCTAMAANL